MSFFPQDPSKYRPSKVLFKIDVLREADRAVQEGLGGYANRHELVNDLVEQGLIELRYPEARAPVPPESHARAESEPEVAADGGDALAPLSDIGETRITALAKKGAAVENELADPEPWPLFGMHNRDAPTAWALTGLAAEAVDGPIPLEAFYEKVTEEAWALAARLSALEAKGAPKLAVMLPRNPEKPQSAAVGFRAFALGAVARKPNEEGKLSASGPFFQWHAVALVGDVRRPQIGLTASGWELVDVFDGLDFSIPHSDEIAARFLAHLAQHAPADLWGFRTALEGAGGGAGRVGMNEYFHKRLRDDYSAVEWKSSVADSVASGYVSRARAWGLVEPGLEDGKYVLTPAGEKTAADFPAAPKA
jgi:hypothetical protein